MSNYSTINTTGIGCTLTSENINHFIKQFVGSNKIIECKCNKKTFEKYCKNKKFDFKVTISCNVPDGVLRNIYDDGHTLDDYRALIARKRVFTRY